MKQNRPSWGKPPFLFYYGTGRTSMSGISVRLSLGMTDIRVIRLLEDLVFMNKLGCVRYVLQSTSIRSARVMDLARTEEMLILLLEYNNPVSGMALTLASKENFILAVSRMLEHYTLKAHVFLISSTLYFLEEFVIGDRHEIKEMLHDKLTQLNQIKE